MMRDILVATARGLHTGGGEVLFEGKDVRGLRAAGGDAVCVVNDHQIWTREEGDWLEVARLDSDDRGLCLLPHRGVLFIGIAAPELLVLRRGVLDDVESFADVESRDEWTTPSGDEPEVRSMDSGADGALYVNVHVGGINRSLDDGATWSSTIPVETDVHQVIFDDASQTLLAATAVGLAMSRDRGDTWSFSSEGLHGDYLRAVAVAGDDVLVSASTGPFTDRAAIYRTSLRGNDRFERCDEGLPRWFDANVDTHWLAAAGRRAAFVAADGRVFASEDGGATWGLDREGLSKPRALVFDAGTE